MVQADGRCGMIQVRDPYWKLEPDLVADETFRERFVLDDEEEDDETLRD